MQNERMIRFEGTLTPDLYRRALGGSGRAIRAVAGLWVIIGIYGLSQARFVDPATWGMPLFLGLLGVLILAAPTMTVKRAFATDRFLAESVAGEADEQGIRIKSANGRADLPWALMHRAALRPNMI